ncbi:xanthine phosphoribosyltransferase [Insolitispirillum peregrinum]|uniref:xanthine phosphoribosyltransferase n=1 Tax=Insolitispirillum peregrinum TaxID=80876 RepID=UPI0036092A0C
MSDYTANRYLPIAWELFHRDTRMLAHKLMDIGPFKGVIAITRGGLIPSSIIARELDLRVVDSISIISYDDRVQGEPRIAKDIDRALVGDGEGWLIIDDLVDSGVTARLVKAHIPKAHLATVYAKPKGEPAVDTYAVPVPQDMWLLFPWDGELQPNEPLARRRG